MIPPLDPFALSFDSIEVDSTRAPSREAIARAMAQYAPKADDAPGFYMLDDAGGRFAVDRDMGVISVLDESLLTTERNQVHAVRLRVVEASGEHYELDMRLRMTGRVPQMVGAEDIDFLAGMEPPPPKPIARAAAPKLELVAPAEPEPVATVPAIAWTRYAACAGNIGAASIAGDYEPFGTLIAAPALSGGVKTAQLGLSAPLPAPARRNAVWAI